jgi:hypothetical protein
LENLKLKILNAFRILEVEMATLTVFRVKSEIAANHLPLPVSYIIRGSVISSLLPIIKKG